MTYLASAALNFVATSASKSKALDERPFEVDNSFSRSGSSRPATTFPSSPCTVSRSPPHGIEKKYPGEDTEVVCQCPYHLFGRAAPHAGSQLRQVRRRDADAVGGHAGHHSFELRSRGR